MAVSDALRRSTIMAGRSSLPLREVALVVTMLNHPALIPAHLDAFCHVELTNPDLDRLRHAILEIAADGEEWEAETLRARLGERRHGPLLARLDTQIAAAGHWPAQAGAALRDAEEGWLQALTLHRRKGTLHKELKDAEAALAKDPSEPNVARLVDIKKELESSEGTEALIEGFGASSGRVKRIF
jgi:DNA primase